MPARTISEGKARRLVKHTATEIDTLGELGNDSPSTSSLPEGCVVDDV